MYCIVRVDLLRQGYASEGPSEIPVWACDEEQGRVYPLQVAQGGPTWHHFQQPRRFGSPDPKAYPMGTTTMWNVARGRKSPGAPKSHRDRSAAHNVTR